MDPKQPPKTATIVASPSYPTLLKRVQSTFADGIFILLLMLGIAAIIDKAGEIPGWVRGFLFIGCWAGYLPHHAFRP